MVLNEECEPRRSDWNGDLTQEEIDSDLEYLEERLRLIGCDGDCAYERALMPTYQLLLEKSRCQSAIVRVEQT